MPDISKCANHSCPMKLECYRFTCKANDFWQSYADFRPDDVTKKCKWLIVVAIPDKKNKE